MSLLKAIPLVGQLIDRFVPDPQAKQAFKLELERLELARDVAGLDAAKGMLSNSHWFVSGAIPSLIWLASVMLATNCVFIPLVQFIAQLCGVPVVIPHIQYPPEYWYLLGVIITGLFAKKSADKGLQLGSFKTAINEQPTRQNDSGQNQKPDWL